MITLNVSFDYQSYNSTKEGITVSDEEGVFDTFPVGSSVEVLHSDFNFATMPISGSLPANKHSIYFHGNRGEELGRLYLEEGELKFTGNVDESAKVFFEQVIKHWVSNNG